MDKNKSEELKNYIVNNYDINNANDVANALKDMFGGVIQSMMNAEFDSSIGYEKSDNKISKTNYRNCSYNKKVKSQFGEFDLEVPRDRNSEFEPVIVPKNIRNISGIEDKVISMYGKGLSIREISETVKDIYGVELSAPMISSITDTVLEEIEEWQKRPLREAYSIVFIDAVHFNVKEENVIVKKSAYVILGITP